MRNLDIFIAVAAARSISEAAKRLHTSQPAVSMQMKRLEEQYGVPLFSSHSRGISLTDAGYVFLEYAERMTALRQQLDRSMSEFKQGGKGHIIIGAPQEIGIYILPGVTSLFLKENPDIQVEIKVLEEQEVEKQVKSGEIDIGFSFFDEVDHLGLRVTRYCTDQWLLVGANNGRLSPPGPLYITGFKPEKLGLPLQNFTTVRLEHAEMMKQLVISGNGAGIMLKSTIMRELERRLLLPLEIVENTWISIVTRPAEKMQKSLWVFIDHVLKKEKNPL